MSCFLNQKNMLKLAHFISLTGIALTLALPESPLLSVLVPNITTENFELKSTGNKYELWLSIVVPEHFRNETVELRAPGTANEELFVNGSSETDYYTLKYESDAELTSLRNDRLTIRFTAGKNGYNAYFHFRKVGFGILKSPRPEQPISPGALKSAAG